MSKDEEKTKSETEKLSDGDISIDKGPLKGEHYNQYGKKDKDDEKRIRKTKD